MTTASEYLKSQLSIATPTAEGRSRTGERRAAIAEHLVESEGFFRLFETGSWSHGTAVRYWSDVDYFATTFGERPVRSYDDLARVRDALASLFPEASVFIDRPAVRLLLHDDAAPDIEVTPARVGLDNNYLIPDPNGSGWIKSSPLKHKEYVDGAQAISSQAKSFIRLIKLWKFRKGVNMSSLYLEMRAAKHIRDHPPYVATTDLYWFFRDLVKSEVAPMNDPSQFDGRRIQPSSSTNRSELLQQVGSAAIHTKLAYEAHMEGDERMAVAFLRLLLEFDDEE